MVSNNPLVFALSSTKNHYLNICRGNTIHKPDCWYKSLISVSLFPYFFVSYFDRELLELIDDDLNTPETPARQRVPEYNSM